MGGILYQLVYGYDCFPYCPAERFTQSYSSHEEAVADWQDSLASTDFIAPSTAYLPNTIMPVSSAAGGPPGCCRCAMHALCSSTPAAAGVLCHACRVEYNTSRASSMIALRALVLCLACCAPPSTMAPAPRRLCWSCSAACLPRSPRSGGPWSSA